MSNVGFSTLTVIPSMRGFGTALNRGVAPISTAQGRSSGRTFGTAFARTSLGPIRAGFGSIGRLAVGAFAGIAAGSFLKGTITAASDLNETISKVAVVLGQDALPGLQEFASHAARDFGQSKQSALDAAATFAVFGKSAGLQGPRLSKFSTSLTGLASDMASFSNTSPEEAITAIAAALRGESEPIRAYGVLLDDASLRQEALAQGLIKTTKTALTPQQRVLAAQALIFKQTADAQGDFARTSGGLANQQRILAAQFTNLKTQVGVAFLPVALKTVGFFNSQLLPAFSKAKTVVGELGVAFRQGETGGAFGTGLTRIASALGALFASFDGSDLTTLKGIGTTLLDRVVPALGELAGALASGLQTAAQVAFDIMGTVGVPAVEALADGMERLAPAARSTAKFLARHEEIITPLAVVLAGYLITVRGIAAATKAWAFWQGAVNVLLLTNPYVAAIAAVAALAGGLVYLNETTGAAHDQFIRLGRVATNITQAIGQSFIDYTNTVLQGLQALSKALDFVTTLGGLVDKNSPFKRFAGQIENAQKKLDGFQHGLNGLDRRIDINVGLHFITDESAVPSGQSLRQLAEGVKTAVEPDRNADASAASRLHSQARARSKAVGQATADGLKDGLSDVPAVADKAGKSIGDGIDKGMQKAQDAIRSRLADIRGEIKAFGDELRSAVSGFFTLQSEGNPFRGVDSLANKAVRFANAIGKLIKQGVPQGLVSQIAALSPDQGLRAATSLLQASQADKAKVIGAFTRVQRAADRTAGLAGQAATEQNGVTLRQQLAEARRQLEELKGIHSAVTKHHKANPLANGWAAT